MIFSGPIFFPRPFCTSRRSDLCAGGEGHFWGDCSLWLAIGRLGVGRGRLPRWDSLEEVQLQLGQDGGQVVLARPPPEPPPLRFGGSGPCARLVNTVTRSG